MSRRILGAEFSEFSSNSGRFAPSGVSNTDPLTAHYSYIPFPVGLRSVLSPFFLRTVPHFRRRRRRSQLLVVEHSEQAAFRPPRSSTLVNSCLKKTLAPLLLQLRGPKLFVHRLEQSVVGPLPLLALVNITVMHVLKSALERLSIVSHVGTAS